MAIQTENLSENSTDAERLLVFAQKLREIIQRCQLNTLFYQKKTRVEEKTPDVIAVNTVGEILKLNTEFLNWKVL